MAWIEDLTPCHHFGSHLAPTLLAVGWLERGRPYSTGIVAADVFTRLVEFGRDPWQPMVAAGVHDCDLCLYRAEASGSANIFVPGDGQLYVCPAIIAHYMNVHVYAPPEAFCRAVQDCPPMRSIAYLKAVLASGGRLLARSARA